MADWVSLAQASREFKLEESVLRGLVARRKLKFKFQGRTAGAVLGAPVGTPILVRRAELKRHLIFRPRQPGWPPPRQAATLDEVMAAVKLPRPQRDGDGTPVTVQVAISRRQLWVWIAEAGLKTWKRSYSRQTWLDLAEVNHFLRHRRLKRPGRRRGGKLAKLSWPQVVEIRARYVPGQTSQRQLAEEFGISQNQISHIVRGQQWKSPGSVPA